MAKSKKNYGILANNSQGDAPARVGLCRYSSFLEESRHHRRTERRVVDVGIAREEDYIDIVPTHLAHLLDCCWQKSHILHL